MTLRPLLHALLGVATLTTILLGAAPASAALTDADYVALERANPLLADADLDLNAAYRDAMAATPEDSRRTLRARQQAWIHARNTRAEAAGPVGSPAFVHALIAQTQARTAELARLATPPQPPAPAPASSRPQVPVAQVPVTRPTSAPQTASAPAVATPAAIAASRPASAPALAGSTPALAASTTAPSATSTEKAGSDVPSSPEPDTAPPDPHRPEKIAAGALAVIVVLGIIGAVEGLGERIVVYTDYTDAAVSTLGSWGSLLCWLGLVIAAHVFDRPGLADDGPYAFGLVLASSLMLTARASWLANRSIVAAVLSMAAKLLLSLAFILYAVIYITSGPNRKRLDGESDAAYALRIQLERERAERNQLAMAAATAATLYLVHNLTREQRWVGLLRYAKG